MNIKDDGPYIFVINLSAQNLAATVCNNPSSVKSPHYIVGHKMNYAELHQRLTQMDVRTNAHFKISQDFYTH